ncbi:hypothetical protein BDW74DRAFT_151397, partial [Aspergillus multicolor]|uniref:uncharacterized protein n=1 Tax=Aspergillus multicolor TaxID=41759 RepID=UPI003CCCD0AB
MNTDGVGRDLRMTTETVDEGRAPISTEGASLTVGDKGKKFGFKGEEVESVVDLEMEGKEKKRGEPTKIWWTRWRGRVPVVVGMTVSNSRHRGPAKTQTKSNTGQQGVNNRRVDAARRLTDRREAKEGGDQNCNNNQISQKRRLLIGSDSGATGVYGKYGLRHLWGGKRKRRGNNEKRCWEAERSRQGCGKVRSGKNGGGMGKKAREGSKRKNQARKGVSERREVT